MHDDLLRSLITAREERRPCALATLAATSGSVPRAAGAKMLVFSGDEIVGTIGGGKFEALVIADCLAAMQAGTPVLKTYPLHEGDAESFGAVCGGEVTVFIEPQGLGPGLVIVGAGHCARAIAALAQGCGWHVTAVDDRAGLLADFPAHRCIDDRTPADFIAGREWRADEALVIVSRRFEIDRDALRATLTVEGPGYIGMMGSRRKVRRVFEELRAGGVNETRLARVFSPIGLDVGADSPAEIAVSVLAEVLAVLRSRPGGHLRAQP